MTKMLVCKHGNPIGVTIEPSEFYVDGHEAGKDVLIQRVTMPVCDQCLLEAVGLKPPHQHQDDKHDQE